MFYKFTLCGVEVRRFLRPSKNVRDAIIALDLKITDFQERNASSRFRNSTEAAFECCEILGEIKFMYLSGLLNPYDYRRVVNRLTGQVFEENDYFDQEV